MTIQTIPDTDPARDVTSSRPIVNPHAAIGALVLWLREEGVSLAHADQSPDACRRRAVLMRQLLAEFGVFPASASDRVAAHAEAAA